MTSLSTRLSGFFQSPGLEQMRESLTGVGRALQPDPAIGQHQAVESDLDLAPELGQDQAEIRHRHVGPQEAVERLIVLAQSCA
jgi:hypothetical protein